jgi:2-phospho-L-lactate guanylyltransferase (CobY/MobA/RfbA family)
MSRLVTPLIFVGASRASPIESLVADAQEAIARDLLERVIASGAFDVPIVATASPGFAASLGGLPVRVVPDEGRFHFGRTLARLIEQFDIQHAFYVGGGAAPLLTVRELTTIAELLLSHEQAIVANNFFSSDFLGFTPAAAIHRISPPAFDNDLAFRLQREAGLRSIALTRTPGTQMDVDTPTDLMILALHPGTGPWTRRFLDECSLDTSRLERVSRYLTDPTAQVIVAGRVGSHLWSHLDTDVACRTRVFSEERGMRASGREARGEVRSLLGFHLSAVGPERFFRELGELGDAAFIDTRVLFNHLRISPSASDRFYSDLLQWQQIVDPLVREFTQAAADAPIPVVLGGHSLVAGGLWALIDAAWLRHDQEVARAAAVTEAC